jgi:hypothetical protein
VDCSLAYEITKEKEGKERGGPRTKGELTTSVIMSMTSLVSPPPSYLLTNRSQLLVGTDPSVQILTTDRSTAHRSLLPALIPGRQVAAPSTLGATGVHARQVSAEHVVHGLGGLHPEQTAPIGPPHSESATRVLHCTEPALLQCTEPSLLLSTDPSLMKRT